MNYLVGHTRSMIFIPAGDYDNQYQSTDSSMGCDADWCNKYCSFENQYSLSFQCYALYIPVWVPTSYMHCNLDIISQLMNN